MVENMGAGEGRSPSKKRKIKMGEDREGREDREGKKERRGEAHVDC